MIRHFNVGFKGRLLENSRWEVDVDYRDVRPLHFEKDKCLGHLFSICLVSSPVLDLHMEIKTPFRAISLLTGEVRTDIGSGNLSRCSSVVFLTAICSLFIELSVILVVELFEFYDLFEKIVTVF